MHYFVGHSDLLQRLGLETSKQPFLTLVALEIPVWLGWFLLVPPLLSVASAFPIAGSRRGIHFGLHLCIFFPLASVVSSLLIAVGRWPLLGLEPGGLLHHWGAYVVVGVAVHTACYSVILLGHHALSRARELHRKELEEARVEGMLARARLQALRSRMHPHFLFNALNGVAGLIGRDDRKARRMMSELGVLLRATISDDDEEVPFAVELALVEKYVALQIARYGERLRFSGAGPLTLRNARHGQESCWFEAWTETERTA